MIPNWWQFLLLALAAYRVWRLIAFDEVTAHARSRLAGHPTLETFTRCPWCFGFWITLALWAAWWVWPHPILVALAPLAISTLVGLTASVDR